jgi:hypothetical protein
MAVSINDESSHVESHLLQGYLDGANVETNDHGRTRSSRLVVSLPEAGESFGSNEFHLPSSIEELPWEHPANY